ncbi:MAG: ribosome-binding factor A [Patescibacteria group bacterium]|jgi:ribosome-binding factor A
MSNRAQRAGEVLRDKLSEIIAREIELPKDSLVTVLRAQISPNLRSAKIWITVSPEENIGIVYGKLRDSVKELRRLLAAKLDWQFTPLLSFRIDRGAMAAQEVERLLEQIRQESKK